MDTTGETGTHNMHTHTRAHTSFHHRARWWIWLVKARNATSWALRFLPHRPWTAKLSRVSLNSGWIGLQINRLPVRSDGCIHLLSWWSLLFTTKRWCCRGWMSFFRMDERLSMWGFPKAQMLLTGAKHIHTHIHTFHNQFVCRKEKKIYYWSWILKNQSFFC